MTSKKRVAIIGTAGVPGRYGGFETLAHHLVMNLNGQFDLTVYCTNRLYKKEERVKTWNGARLVYLPLNANGLQSIFYDIISVIHALFVADVLMIFGVSGGLILPFVRLFTRKKIVVNIDGLEWRREKWSKPIRIFLKLSEMVAVRYAHADITDNAAIKRYTAIYYKTLSHLIAYGADHCSPEVVRQNHHGKYPFLYGKYAFKVARIEPENHIHTILEAFAQFDHFPLVIVGNWENSEYGKKLKAQYGSLPGYYLLDPIYEIQELNMLRSNCFVYVHGHSAGGTNPSLVEAMYLGLPVLSYDVSYNRATTDGKALYFKDAATLRCILQMTPSLDLQTIADHMKQIAEREYTWEKIARSYAYLVHIFDHGYARKRVLSKWSKVSYSQLTKVGLAHLKNPVPFFEK